MQFIKAFLYTPITSEQRKFEEEFKYLIVTSLNEATDQQQPATTSTSIQVSIPSTEIFYASTIFLMAYLITMKWNATTLTCLMIIYSAMGYFLYRHHRYTQIKTTHVSALRSMYQLISLSRESAKLQSQLIYGSSLQESADDALGKLLSAHFQKYTHAVDQLHPYIDANNLARLRDMYNMKHDMPSRYMNTYTSEDIERLYTLNRWKQYDYLLHLLAIPSDKQLNNYQSNWKRAAQITQRLVCEYTDLNQALLFLVNNLPEIEEIEPTTTTDCSDKIKNIMAHKLNVLESMIDEIQAKLFLYQQETRHGGRGFQLEHIQKKFQVIDVSIQNLIEQWKESKRTLNTFIDEQTYDLIPSPPSSP